MRISLDARQRLVVVKQMLICLLALDRELEVNGQDESIRRPYAREKRQRSAHCRPYLTDACGLPLAQLLQELPDFHGNLVGADVLSTTNDGDHLVQTVGRREGVSKLLGLGLQHASTLRTIDGLAAGR